MSVRVSVRMSVRMLCVCVSVRVSVRACVYVVCVRVCVCVTLTRAQDFDSRCLQILISRTFSVTTTKTKILSFTPK